MTTSFDLQLPAPQKSLPDTATVQVTGSLVILGANGSGKTRLGAWLEMESGQKDKVHRVSAQKSLTMPVVSVSTSIDAAKADLIFGYKEGNFGHKAGNRWGGNPNTFLLNDFEKLSGSEGMLPLKLSVGSRRYRSGFCNCRPLKRALFLAGVVLPGLRSLRPLTRGYQYAAPLALVDSH